MKLTRPKLRTPDVKAPPFLVDIYYDLRERRLLPLVALVIIAILAVPFLLGGDSGEESPAAPSAAEVVSPTEAETASLTVVEAKPGLRDYKKRLRGRTPTDPFAQRYTGLPEGAKLSVETTTATSSAGDGSSAVTGTETDVTSAPTGTAPQSTPPSSGGSGGGSKKGDGDGDDSPLDGKRLFGFRPDVRFGVAGSDDLSLHKELPLGSFLPRSNPVLVFIGVTQNGNRALFDVSREVSWVQGDGDCVGGKAACQVISLKQGQAANLQTAMSTFRLAIVDIDFVEVDVPREASSSSAKAEPRVGGLVQNFSK